MVSGGTAHGTGHRQPHTQKRFSLSPQSSHPPGGVSFEAIAKISFACEAAGDQSHVLFHLRPSAWREGPSEGSGGSEDPFGDRSQEFYFRENVEEPAAVPTVGGDQLKARALKLSPDRIDPVSASVALESIHPAHKNAHRTIGRRKNNLRTKEDFSTSKACDWT